MELIINIIICILLLFLIKQDFKYRAIHVGIIVALFLLSSVIYYLKTEAIYNFPTLSLVLVTFLLVSVYLSLKNSQLVNPFKSHIGLGDMLFLIAITPLFYLHNFIVFLISGLLLSLLIILIFRKRINTNSIPLAGILSGYLLIFIFTDYFSNLDLFYTNFLFQKLL